VKEAASDQKEQKQEVEAKQRKEAYKRGKTQAKDFQSRI